MPPGSRWCPGGEGGGRVLVDGGFGALEAELGPHGLVRDYQFGGGAALEGAAEAEIEVGRPSNHPPAEPEAFRLLAPQRGLIAIAQNKSPRLKLNLSPKCSRRSGHRALV